MSNGPNNMTYFYMGAQYGLPILILVFIIILGGTLISLLMLSTLD